MEAKRKINCVVRLFCMIKLIIVKKNRVIIQIDYVIYAKSEK